MKSVEQKIKESVEELKDVNEQLSANSAKQNGAYSSLDKMYDEGGYDLEDYSILQTAKNFYVKRGSQLYRQKEKLVKRLIKLIKRRKIKPDDELKQLLNLN